MPLRTIVKVGNISNLSDARYCSGMGVEMLGFSVVAGHANYTSPTLFQEIRGWIAGPKVVAELYGMDPSMSLDQVIENYRPDYFEIDSRSFQERILDFKIPCIISLDELEEGANHPLIEYYIVSEAFLAGSAGRALTRPTLARVAAAKDATRILNQYPVSGLALNGTPEVRPGYKDYDALAETLEMLEDG